MLKRLLCLALIIVTTAFALPGRANAAIEGSVIMAKAGADPVFIWDASISVASELVKKQTTEQSLTNIELLAAQVAAAKLQAMKTLDKISIQVIYTKSGAVSPKYGGPIFAGVEHLVTVSTTRAAAESASLANATALPAGFTANVTGTLPPQR
jgi:hypothetical protein